MENNDKKGLKAIWVDPDVHDLLWIYKVKNKKKSIGEVASYFIKLAICQEEINNGKEN